MRGGLLLIACVAACGRSDQAKPVEQRGAGDVVVAVRDAAVAVSDAVGDASSAVAAGEPANLTPDQLYARGAPTFVVGTLGDDKADRAILGQAQFISELFPGSKIVPDTSIDVAAGPSGWPANPVLYGGSHMNAVVAALGAALPVSVTAERIEVGGEIFLGVGARVLTVVPAGAKNPDFVLYAGTGTPGIEVARIRHGWEPLLIGDLHGRLQSGTWVRGPDGTVTAKLASPARRVPWRIIERPVAGVTMRVAFVEQLAAAPDEAAVVDAVIRGVTRAATKLAVTAPPRITVYVYPDHRSKETLTGDKGDGHAMASGAALHVVRYDPAPGGGFENLVAHEFTHSITGQLWGPAGTVLVGEGVAVWASGQYGGRSLADWQKKLTSRPSIVSLLPMKAFSSKPEPETYPFGGILVAAAVDLVGLAAVRDHLYEATPGTWADACKAAGTTAEALDAAVAARR